MRKTLGITSWSLSDPPLSALCTPKCNKLGSVEKYFLCRRKLNSE